MRRTLWLAPLAAALLLAWPGCATESQRRSLRDDPDAPACLERARFLEDRAIQTILEGNDHGTIPATRAKFYDRAMSDLEEAQSLYEVELLDTPGSDEKQHFMKSEIDRIAARVAHLSKIRPID